MMLSRDACAAAVEQRLTADDFYKPAHGTVFAAVLGLYDAFEPVGPVAVSNELRRSGDLDRLGGLPALEQLVLQTPASATASHYARTVHELALLRRLIAVAGEISDLGYGESLPPRETLDRAEQLVFEVAESEVSSEVVGLATIVDDALARVREPARERVGIETGYANVDDILLGLQDDALYIVAARPGVGKTAFALGAAHAVAKAGLPVLMFSMEMSRSQIGDRMLASAARVDLRRIQLARLSDQERVRVEQHGPALHALPLELVDNQDCTVMELRAIARRAKTRHRRLGLIVVDYLQLMSPSIGARREHNREREVAEFARGLKMLAREIECPVLGLSQLNRGVEIRNEKRPTLADLRESGEIENSADAVLMLYRPDMYDGNDDEEPGATEVIVAKHRLGACGTAHLTWLGPYVRFQDHEWRREGPT